jgi:hypothetical protein
VENILAIALNAGIINAARRIPEQIVGHAAKFASAGM